MTARSPDRARQQRRDLLETVLAVYLVGRLVGRLTARIVELENKSDVERQTTARLETRLLGAELDVDHVAEELVTAGVFERIPDPDGLPPQVKAAVPQPLNVRQAMRRLEREGLVN